MVRAAAELSGGVRLVVRAVQLVAGLGLLGNAVSVLMRGPGQASVLLDGWLAHAVLVGSVVLCLLRAGLVRTERWV